MNKRLIAQWERRLRKEGLAPLEDEKGRLLEHSGYRIKSNYTPTTFAAKQRYYELADQLYHSGIITNEVDKQIWSYHCQGIEYKEIARLVRLSKTNVFNRVKKYAKYITRD